MSQYLYAQNLYCMFNPDSSTATSQPSVLTSELGGDVDCPTVNDVCANCLLPPLFVLGVSFYGLKIHQL